jgi:hypothetical protein
VLFRSQPDQVPCFKLIKVFKITNHYTFVYCFVGDFMRYQEKNRINKKKIILKKAVDNSLVGSLSYQLNRRQIEQLKIFSHVVLALIGAAGIITLGLVAPNALKTIKYCRNIKRKFENLAADEKQARIERTFYYLRSSGLLKFKEEENETLLLLTGKAKKLLQTVGYQTMQVTDNKVWNKKWWLVAADIPTKEHRLGADQFRRKLKNMSFYPLQRTLWVYPHDPRKEIKFITEMFGISKFITVMEINRLELEDEKNIKKFFSL